MLRLPERTLQQWAPSAPLSVALIVGLAGALYFVGLGAEPFYHPLEAKYALAAREMLRGGPLLVPHLFGELYPDKPPLYFWTVAALARLRGGQLDEIAARLPAATAALLTLLVVYRLGADLFGRRAGLLSAAILGTNFLFFRMARGGFLDQFLTAFVALAVAALGRSLVSTTPGRAAGWAALAYAAMALGVLSKGLLGLVLPLMAVGGYLAATGPLRSIPGRLQLLPGLAVFSAVVLAWFGPAVARYGTAYLHETVIHQHVVRYVHTWAHAGPWYYYLGELPVDFFPWIVFLPVALATACGAWRAETALPARPVLLPLSWFVTGFLFFTLSSGKRSPYLLPLYPAAALLIGWLWDGVLAGSIAARWVGRAIAAWGALTVLLSAALIATPERLLSLPMAHLLVPTDRWLRAGIAGLAFTMVLAVVLRWRVRRRAAAFAALVLGHVVLLGVLGMMLAARTDAEFPVRAFAARVQSVVPPGDTVLGVAEDFRVAFYIDRPWRPVPRADAPGAIAAAAASAWVFVDSRDQAWPAGTRTERIAELQYKDRTLSLLRLGPRPP